MSAFNSSFEGFAGTPPLLSPPRAQGPEAEDTRDPSCFTPPAVHANDDVFSALSKPLKMKCTRCPRLFESLDGMQQHIEEDHGTVVSISCKNCNQSFPNSYTYRSHVDHCKLGTNKNRLKRISPITTMRKRDPLPDIAARRMLCVHCEEGFTSKEAIERHHLKHHAICLRFGDLCYTASTRRFVCRDSSCGYMEFNGWQKLISHYRTQHGEPAVQTRRVLLEGNVSAVTQLMQSQPRIVFPRTALSAPRQYSGSRATRLHKTTPFTLKKKSTFDRQFPVIVPRNTHPRKSLLTPGKRATELESTSPGSVVGSSSASFEDHSLRPNDIQDEAFDSPFDDFFEPENSVSFTPIDQTPIVGRSVGIHGTTTIHHLPGGFWINPASAAEPTDVCDDFDVIPQIARETDSEAAIEWDSGFWEQSSTVEIGPKEHPVGLKPNEQYDVNNSAAARELLALSREMADEHNMTLH